MATVQERMIELGHDPRWDPPGLSSGKRWTCGGCGKAGLDYQGNQYGSALVGRCAAREEENRRCS